MRISSGVPALAAALISTDAPMRAAVVGVREAGHGDPVQRGDLFHIGSCTKPMTADLIATLVEEGRLSWTSTVGQLFPELAATMRPEYREATLEQLLSHRAGIQSYTSIDDAELARLAALGGGDAVQARELFAAEVLQKPPVSAPGTETHYSNAGYALAAHAAERLTGQSWEQLITKRIFIPLGMRSCRFGFPATRTDPRQPRGHVASGSGLIVTPIGDGRETIPVIASSGDVSCSLDDFARFAAYHLDHLTGGERRGPLQAATIRRMHTPLEGTRTGSALGWGVSESSFGGLSSGILGSLECFTALMVVIPERHVAVVVMTNVGEEGPGKATVIGAAKRIVSELAPPAPGKD